VLKQLGKATERGKGEQREVARVCVHGAVWPFFDDTKLPGTGGAGVKPAWS